VTDSHEAIEELLAGYVLRSLSGEDATQADRLLSDHVPFCPTCRDSLAVFQGVTADLALAAQPLDPPETLLPRLHRDLGARGSRRRPAAVFAVAASVVAVVGLAGLTVSQGVRANDAQARMNNIAQAFEFARRPGASMVSVDSSSASAGPITEISEPGVEEFFLVGRDLPSPPPGTVYRVWLVSGTDPTFAGEFLPEPDFTVVHLEFDPNVYDRILITVESAEAVPTSPLDPVWQAAS
jgi:hypothetical protein